MNCPTKETVSRYLDGELSPQERSRVEEHLRTCEACQAARRELEGVGRALELFCLRGEAPPVRAKAKCPGDDAIAAFADGSIVSPKERLRIARHLAECELCARKAGEAAEAARLARELEERGLESVPPALAARVRDRFMPGNPVLAGEIAASVKEILKRAGRGLEFDGPEYGHIHTQRAFVSEKRVQLMLRQPSREIRDLEPEESLYLEKRTVRYHGRIAGPDEGEKKPPGKREPKQKKPRRKKRRLRKGLDWLFRKEGLQVLVSLRGTPGRTIDCRIELTDEADRPLPGVRVALEKDDREPLRSRTGTRGGAAFRGLAPGRYRLVVFHDREIHVKLDLT